MTATNEGPPLSNGEKHNDLPLARRPSGAITKVAPGANRILSGIAADALALAKKSLRKIVIVDHDRAFLDGLSETIRLEINSNATILAFDESPEGLTELLSQPSPDLLLLSTHMPSLSGYSILRILTRKNAKYPILLMSARMDDFREYRFLSETCANLNAKIIYRQNFGGSRNGIHMGNFFKELGTALRIPGTTFLDALEVAHAKIAQINYDIGWRYIKGEGVVRDEKEIANFFRGAAVGGNTLAWYKCGEYYLSGERAPEFPQDIKYAFHWFRKAAEKGHAWAQVWTAASYRSKSFGNAIFTQDFPEAYKWTKLAAEQGHPVGISSLPRLTSTLSPEQLQEGERRYREFKLQQK